MFTIGIFSTHIPYIAFVLFYAYFFVSGVQKAVDGEIPLTDKCAFISEIQAEQDILNQDSSNDTYNYKAFVVSDFERFIFKRKIKYRIKTTKFFHSIAIFTSLFERPPPFVS
ncbi:hypothetical protein [Maribellus maritimus]|uniref:hypothetical protein n=1 Tax=Maribellus maritimus TaxID=2870838 RepID=UPI001EEC825D|nr:hypothetical protein [Maribellus maritimus]MCG6187184.1 hypothetical protein [Maribellus maritimus]